MKIIEFKVDEEKDCVVEAISFVDKPAIEKDYMFFNKTDKTKIKKVEFAKATIDKEQRLVTGPALIPDKLIGRFDRESQEMYAGFFSKQTVKDISEIFLKQLKTHNTNEMHDGVLLDKVYLAESWLVNNPECDKAKDLGFSVPKGTWMTTFKVNNEHLWNEIKSGKLRGFSIEGNFITEYFKK